MHQGLSYVSCLHHVVDSDLALSRDYGLYLYVNSDCSDYRDGNSDLIQLSGSSDVSHCRSRAVSECSGYRYCIANSDLRLDQ